MEKPFKIGVLGIGAVGGYFGGLLAEHFAATDAVQVIFIARPETSAIIRENGLKLITPERERTIHPALVTSDASGIGPLDLLICTTKSYDLEEALKLLALCITEDTIILPLLNGVDAKERIGNMYPQASVLYGCAYIVARRIAPGVVKETGNVHKLHFGSEEVPADKLVYIQDLFQSAGIESYLSADAKTDVWEKYVFTASMASSTSFFDQTIGQVMQDPEHKETARALIRETKAIADAQGIVLPEGIEESTIGKMERMPFDATSSMHSDFQKGGSTEYRSLTEYVAILGDQLHIETPEFDTIVAAFKDRAQR